MSVRATWSSVDYVDVEVTDEFEDQHNSTVDNIAIVLGQDADCFVIEGTDTEHLRDFVDRLTAALDKWDDDHPAQ